MSGEYVGKSFRGKDSVKQYCVDHSSKLHPALVGLYRETLKLPMGFISGAPEVVLLNQNLIRSVQGRKVLDIGVFTGVSSLAAGLAIPPDGTVVACETNAELVETGKPFWREAGVEDRITLRLQPAARTLEELVADGQSGTFDFAFIDADKASYDTYYELCLKLVRSGGIISIDNVLWGGSVLKPEIDDRDTIALKELNEKMAKDDRVNVSFLNIGDGLALVFKK